MNQLVSPFVIPTQAEIQKGSELSLDSGSAHCSARNNDQGALHLG
jgi:hypothetical protein